MDGALGNNPQIIIKNDMSTSEIIEQIGKRVQDVTKQLNLEECNDVATENGGFGDIYCGRLLDGTKVALKCLRLEVNRSAEGRQVVESFANELYVWSKCNHPHVTRLIGMAEYRNQFTMVSPWVGKGSLARLLHNRSYSFAERYQLCLRIISGVAYLRATNIVHGDLKAANILMSDGNVPFIVDFGCSIIKGCSLIFRSSNLLSIGTVRWTAPEILEADNAKPSYEADVYSLGMTILEVMTGSKPYTGMNEASALMKITAGIAPERPNAHIPSGHKQADSLWSLLTERCWAYEPKARIHVAELYHQMQAILELGC